MECSRIAVVSVRHTVRHRRALRTRRCLPHLFATGARHFGNSLFDLVGAREIIGDVDASLADKGVPYLEENCIAIVVCFTRGFDTNAKELPRPGPYSALAGLDDHGVTGDDEACHLPTPSGKSRVETLQQGAPRLPVHRRFPGHVAVTDVIVRHVAHALIDILT